MSRLSQRPFTVIVFGDSKFILPLLAACDQGRYKIMKFKDLLNLQYGINSDLIDKKELMRILPKTPEDVIEQFYSDHGRKDSFQNQYEKIDLSRIMWSLLSVRADKLSDCSYYKRFETRVNACAAWGDHIANEGWDYLNFYPVKVVNSWKTAKSWFRIPIMINGNLINLDSTYHLVEGHSRLGLLKGLVRSAILENASSHKIWYGDYK